MDIDCQNQVKNCATTDLPPGFRGEKEGREEPHNKYSEEANQDCDEDYGDEVDSTISEAASNDLRAWARHDDAQSDFCELDSSWCQDCVHVDLTLNPERFTGYSGEASRRVWRTIYEENCFSPKGVTTNKPQSFSASFGAEPLQTLCLEKRAFFRAVSGLHTSITIHLTANYPADKISSAPFLGSQEVWGPNIEEFQKRFDPDLTDGQGPYWLKNLYFVYLLELRALAKASPYFTHQTFYTGRESEDKDTNIAVRELLNLIQSFPDHFDESSMFAGGKHAQVQETLLSVGNILSL